MERALDSVADSRRLLLQVIGDEPDLTLVRAGGNLGDELIRAGTHRLLARRPFREIGLDELAAASGRTVLLPGGGAWCRPYHEWMPYALGIAELRFERVIVLPSSFDPGEDSVRHALEKTRATVFARERTSLELIRDYGAARLAHDCAFFFDFSPYVRPGVGTLNAFRTDPEGFGADLPPDNRDISREAAGPEDWLELIAAHAVVRTDRAHVMIAAALMDKTVQAAPSRYHKIPALAETWLRDFPVELIRPADGAQRAHRRTRRVEPRPSRVAAVVVSRDRPDRLDRAVRSILGSAAVGRVVVIDSNSDPVLEPRFTALAASDDRVLVRRVERDLGQAGGRRLGVELAEADFVLIVDDQVELYDGAVERLLADLDASPDAAGVTPVVVNPDGVVRHFGGDLVVGSESAEFSLGCAREAKLPPSGATGWLPSGCLLVRASVLSEIPFDEQMVPAYEDAEWSYRVSAAGLGLRRCREAVVMQADGGPASPPSSQLADCAQRVERLVPMARFYERHHLLPAVDLACVAPELRLPDGNYDLARLRRLLELVSTQGVDWTVMEWMNGGLDPLWEGRRPSSSASAGERRRRRLLTRRLRLPRRLHHDLDGA